MFHGSCRCPLQNIGSAVAAIGLLGAALEAVIVGVARFGHAKQVAEVVEMDLGAGAFGERVVLPDGDELFGVHGAAAWGRKGRFRASMAACRD